MKKIALFYACLLFTISTLTSCGDENMEKEEISVNEITTTNSISDLNYSSDTTISTTIIETTTAPVTTVQSTSSTTTTTTQTTTQPVQTTTVTATANLNQVQENSVAWLNYLAMLSQEINSSQNSKMYLEKAYAALINNTNPENVDEPTESQLVSLLDIIEKYRMIAEKRERLQYIYEQNQAKALKEAMPNPVALLSATSSIDPKKLISSVVYMAVDSYSSYSAYKNEISQEYLKSGWELDDEAAENLHNSRKRAFTYMLEIVRQYELPGKLALNESAIEKFVECKNNTNTFQQVQFLEANKETYSAFGNYWLLLAECYYNNGEYKKCLNCISEYEELYSGIFRKDYSLAITLPLAIVSASEVYSEKQYIETAEKYLEMLIDNTEDSEWSLRYFSAEIYLDLYTRTKDSKYLRKAYDIALNNVNFLVKKQKEINNTYLSAVKEVSITDKATKKEKKQIKSYNKKLHEIRETELPEIYEPLAINCDMLFSLANKLNVSQSEKNKIEGILAGDENPIFINKPLNNLFSFKSSKMFVDASFDKDEIILPVSYVSKDSQIKVTVTSGDEKFIFDDWKIDEVKRPKGKENELSSFKVTFTSETAKDCSWNKESKIKIEISNGDYSNSEPLVIYFKVSEYKKRKIGWDTVKFEQVDAL